MLRLASKRLLGQAPPRPAQILSRFYHENVIDHFNNPRNVGSFDKNDPTVGTGLVGAPACGDVMKLQIKVDEKTGEIVDARFKTFGCGSAIASSSVGRLQSISLPPVKLHCSMLAEDAIKAAVKDYQTKRAKVNGTPDAAPVEQAAQA
ncbi:hypothetical protein GH714_040703 [Hevea brasiliensis]|uniref:NIF system FeS cluster assembly NifU N-terminal domain-containing protein n=1 Tax=Hevea brasiliensis TaxID=3981 RepID=A0A6A6MU00_HEVBR|nr:hypothetical protein GH714_040703 [Hevea brasiliensis]